MPFYSGTAQARVIVLLINLQMRLAGTAPWSCSVNIQGDSSQLLVYDAASMHCQNDAASRDNLTVYADASLMPYASSFIGTPLRLICLSSRLLPKFKLDPVFWLLSR